MFNKNIGKPEETIRKKPLISIKSQISPLKTRKVFTTRIIQETSPSNKKPSTPQSIQNKF